MSENEGLQGGADVSGGTGTVDRRDPARNAANGTPGANGAGPSDAELRLTALKWALQLSAGQDPESVTGKIVAEDAAAFYAFLRGAP